jgi:hypothetical protein
VVSGWGAARFLVWMRGFAIPFRCFAGAPLVSGYEASPDPLYGCPFRASFIQLTAVHFMVLFRIGIELSNVVYDDAPLRAWFVRCLFPIQFFFIFYPPGHVYKDETGMASQNSWPGLASHFIALGLVGWLVKERMNGRRMARFVDGAWGCWSGLIMGLTELVV